MCSFMDRHTGGAYASDEIQPVVAHIVFALWLVRGVSAGDDWTTAGPLGSLEQSCFQKDWYTLNKVKKISCSKAGWLWCQRQTLSVRRQHCKCLEQGFSHINCSSDTRGVTCFTLPPLYTFSTVTDSKTAGWNSSKPSDLFHLLLFNFMGKHVVLC